MWLKYNINGRDVQRKNVVNNVDKSSLPTPWQNGPYKNTQNITKHGVTKTQQTLRNSFFCVVKSYGQYIQT